MASKAALQNAYITVNGLKSKMLVTQEPHKSIIANAIHDVWQYQGLYDGEDEIMREKRLDIDGPENDEVVNLANYFCELDPNLSSENKTNVIFIMYNRMKSLENQPVSGEESVEVEDKDELSEIKPNNMEEKKMSEFTEKVKKENADMLSELEAGLQANLGSDIASMPSDASADRFTQDAARNAVNNEEASRVNATKNTKIVNVILSTPAAKDRLVSKENPVGTIANAEKLLSSISLKFGAVVGGDGTVSFTNVRPEYIDAATKMYNFVAGVQAGNTDATLPAHVGTGLSPIKAERVSKPNGEVEIFTHDEIKDYLIKHTVGVLGTAAEGCQFQLGVANRSTTRSNQGTGTRTTGKSKDAYKGIATIKVTNRQSALENGSFVQYHKELTAEHSAKAGFRSELAVKYETTGKDGTTKKLSTYRLPLMVDQYECKVTDTELLSKLGDGQSAAGRQQKPIDLSNSDEIKAQLNTLITVVANASAAGVQGFDEIRKTASSASASEAADAAKDFNGGF